MAGNVLTPVEGSSRSLAIEGWRGIAHSYALVNQWQLIAWLEQTEPHFPKGSQTLLAALHDFEITYAAYAEFQRNMERYWCLRWLGQEQAKQVDAVVLKEDVLRLVDIPLVIRLAGLPQDEFKALNPSQNKPVILAAGTPQVLLPYDNANLFVHNLSRHKGALATWTAWQVPRTMRPADAAKQVGMSETGLRELNHIPPKMLVKAGSTLLVPRPEHREQDVSEALADNAMMALAPDLPPLRRVSFKAGKRDSVASVAKRYRVSAQQVAQWNRTSSGASFGKGQTVVVFVPAGNAMAKAQDTANSNGPSRRAESTKVASTASRRGVVRVASAVPAPRATATRSSSAAKPRATPAARGSRIRVASAR